MSKYRAQNVSYFIQEHCYLKHCSQAYFNESSIDYDYAGKIQRMREDVTYVTLFVIDWDLDHMIRDNTGKWPSVGYTVSHFISYQQTSAVLNILSSVRQDPDIKFHEANMGPTWVLSPQMGPMNLAIRGRTRKNLSELITVITCGSLHATMPKFRLKGGKVTEVTENL